MSCKFIRYVVALHTTMYRDPHQGFLVERKVNTVEKYDPTNSNRLGVIKKQNFNLGVPGWPLWLLYANLIEHVWSWMWLKLRSKRKWIVMMLETQLKKSYMYIYIYI